MAVPPPPPPPPDAHHPADAHHLADAGHVWRWPASGGIVVSAPAALSRRAIFGRVKSRRGRGALDANRLMTSATSSRSAAPLSRAAERRGVAWRGRLSPAAAPATCSDRSPSLVTRPATCTARCTARPAARRCQRILHPALYSVPRWRPQCRGGRRVWAHAGSTSARVPEQSTRGNRPPKRKWVDRAGGARPANRLRRTKPTKPREWSRLATDVPVLPGRN